VSASAGGSASAPIAAEEIYDEGPLYAAAKKVYPQKVWGTYRRLKWAVLWFALGVYYILPFVRWDRGPNQPNQAVLIDMEHSRFYAFFIELWPQEVYYFTGLLILAALILFLSNALFGRVWCGYACPQTVWTDLFLWVERAIEGDRRERIKFDDAPWSPDKLVKRLAKHAAWLVIAMLTGGAFVLYFMDAPTLLVQFATFQAPLIAYLWAGILTLTTYSLAGHMREQVCLYMCPWPRIQAALTDPDALEVTYRTDRGEPRMSVKEAARKRAQGSPAGDCIDCFQCVHACPTGVDIRKGLQLGCINCGLCIDACDAVMTKIQRPLRLIAFDTDDNIVRRKRGEPAVYHLIRPRTILYLAAIALTGCIMLYAFVTRTNMHLSVLHVRAPLFTVTAQGGVRNGYTLRFSNKLSKPSDFALTVSGLKGAMMTSVVAKPLSDGRLTARVDADATFEVPVYVSTPPGASPGKSTPITFTATDVKTGEASGVVDNFFGPITSSE
jgi:cytochrome c oxidase accessory protein FixG